MAFAIVEGLLYCAKWKCLWVDLLHPASTTIGMTVGGVCFLFKTYVT